MADDELDEVLRRSRKLHGGLGAVAFTVLEAMRRGGADEQAVARMHEALGACFSPLSDRDCDLVCRVLAARLDEERGKGGFYGS